MRKKPISSFKDSKDWINLKETQICFYDLLNAREFTRSDNVLTLLDDLSMNVKYHDNNYHASALPYVSEFINKTVLCSTYSPLTVVAAANAIIKAREAAA